MTKIESENRDDRELLKREIINEIRAGERRRRIAGCLVKLFVDLLIIGIPLYLLAMLLAKTGFVSIPLLTDWYYRPPMPVRVVQPLAGTSAEDVLRVAAARVKLDTAANRLAFGLKESELTTLVKAGVDSAALPFPITNVQIAVDPDRLEFFAVTPKDGRNVPIVANIVPSVIDGQLRMKLESVRLGALELPQMVSGAFAALIDRSLGDALTAGLASIGQLKAVKLETGELIFEIAPAAR